MMKFILMNFFMIFMILMKNYFIMFYFNLCYLMSLMFMMMYMGKVYFWGVSNFGGCDMYSYFLILLSFWIIGLMIMSVDFSESSIMMKLIIFMMMMINLLLFFYSMNLILFYIFFEIILIPTFFLIIYWGGNPERINAGFYLLLYMMVFSLPLLYYIFKFLDNMGTLNMVLMENFFQNQLSLFSFVIIMSVFLVKLPIYLFHIWLPKAHVEAPVYGSMILAGVLLKLGGYGLLRLMMIMMNLCLKFSYLIFSVGIMGSLVTSILCLVQIDMKSLVAYSSVVHMNMMLCSMMTMFKMGFYSALILMISHGLCSSGLFYMVNLYYKWSMSRLLILNKGVMNLFPSVSLWWFLLCVSNFSFPFSLNFISEIYMVSVIMNWDKMFVIYLMLVCFMSSAYSLYLYSYVQHGGGLDELNKKWKFMGMFKEFMVMILHFYPLLMILLNLILFM